MNEKFYKNILYNSPIGYAYHEIILDEMGTPCDYRFIEINPAFELFTGLLSRDIIGKTVLEVIPEIVKDDFDWISFYGDIALNNKKDNFESFSKKLKSWYKVEVFSQRKNFFTTIFSDITAEKQQSQNFSEFEITFSNVIKRAPIPIMIHSEDGKVLYLSDIWTEISGYTKDDIPTIQAWTKLAYGDQQDNVIRIINKRFESNQRKHEGEFLITAKDSKKLKWDFNSGYIGTFPDGKKVAMSVATDITEINNSNERLKESERSKTSLLSNLPGFAYRCKNDEFWTMLFVSQGFKNLTGWEEKDVLNNSCISYEDIILESYRKNIRDGWVKAIRNKVNFVYEYEIVKKNGKKIWVWEKGTPLIENGECTYIEGFIEDITELKKKEDELIYLSYHDYLTGLYNRRYFVEKFNKLDIPKNYPLGLIMIDVNGLKIINDAFGHSVGDIALKKVSEILEKSCRKNDFVCRIGGDEFAVILPNISLDELEIIKETIRTESKVSHVKNVALSLATGYEIKTKKQKENLDEVLKLAENHMYRHKLAEGISIRNNAIKAILKTLTNKYEEERIHSAKVSSLCRIMGVELGLKDEDVKELELAGMYHDIGKISIPDALLNKPGKLTKEEFEIIKTHPKISYQILRAADEYSDLAIHALHHHERWDGLGYPSGKKGEDIPLFSRIICVIDAFEAMTAVRVYKDKMSEDDAVNEIIQCSGSQFDERIAKVFVEQVLKKTWNK